MSFPSEFSSRLAALDGVRYDDAQPRFKSFMELLNSEPHLAPTLADLRTAARHLVSGRDELTPPDAGTPREIAAVGLYLLDAWIAGREIYDLTYEIGIKPLHNSSDLQTILDDALRRYISPFVRYVRDALKSAVPSDGLDALTLLRRREALDRDLPLAVASASASAPVAVIFADIDHFKRVNDAFSHQAGDAALRTVAQCFRQVLGNRGSCYRYGGEEFVAVLPCTDTHEARHVAERLRLHVAECFIPEIKGTVTVSIGVVVTTSSQVPPATILHSADRAMYEGKAAGRNRVVVGETITAPGNHRQA